MTLEEMKALPEGRQKALYNKIKEIRNLGKVVNFSSVYGAGPPKIALTTGMPLKQAQKLHKTYWDRNKSVKQVANSARTKTTKFMGEEQMWLYNPVSKFWYTLRYEKDKFSTLNQGKIRCPKICLIAGNSLSLIY